MELKDLKNIGPKRLMGLEKLNIRSIQDLVFFAPYRYEDRQTEVPIYELEDKMDSLVHVRIMKPAIFKRIGGGRTITSFIGENSTGTIEIQYFNQPWIRRNIKVGTAYYFFGKISKFRNKVSITNPIYQTTKQGELGRIVPIYAANKHITQKLIRQAIEEALYCWEPIELLPKAVQEKLSLDDVKTLLYQIHFPKSFENAQSAIKKMAYIEAFLLHMGLHNNLTIGKKSLGVQCKDTEEEREFLRKLPFLLTKGQKDVIVDLKKDLEHANAMHRLLQGDVGSGKTVVAQYAAIKTVASGYQVAFMAPTAILAKQNYEKLKRMVEPFDYKISLLTSECTAKETKEIYSDLNEGRVHIVVGTHSLLNEKIQFSNLGLVIIDEQHRFGVKQRSDLIDKSMGTNLLVMSATPIPRSLALILYGEMDISEIRELPSGRVPIETTGVRKDQMNKVHAFVESQIEKGRQAYYVCPLIEESKKMDLQSATILYEEVQDLFKDRKVAMVTGKQSQDTKDFLMHQFYTNEIQVLVSTTVIEVGIDVPNATVMVIMNSERFGLSQMHQLRGRVGRGKHKSYCILVYDGEGEDAFRRLKTMERTSDGFEISMEDLKLRGPGEFLGFKQHGAQKFRFLDFSEDFPIVVAAKKEYVEYANTVSEEEIKTFWDRVKTIFGSVDMGVLN
ncbi:MAG: ATP-dependent DNA helicase RecG [Tissierellia bacterium]|nr:ATP-dependent DNA helicase RecG [Tissierellia bacterium]